MTAALQSSGGASAAGQVVPYVVGAVDSGGTAWLYLRGSVGTLGPISTFKGNNINRVQSSTTVPFTLDIAPASLAQSFFTYLVVIKSDGTWVRLPSSGTGVTYTADAGGVTRWAYSAAATSQVWNTPGNYGFLLSP